METTHLLKQVIDELVLIGYSTAGQEAFDCITEHRTECGYDSTDADTQYDRLFQGFQYNHAFYCEYNLSK